MINSNKYRTTQPSIANIDSHCNGLISGYNGPCTVYILNGVWFSTCERWWRISSHQLIETGPMSRVEAIHVYTYRSMEKRQHLHSLLWSARLHVHYMYSCYLDQCVNDAIGLFVCRSLSPIIGKQIMTAEKSFRSTEHLKSLLDNCHHVHHTTMWDRERSSENARLCLDIQRS